MKKRFFVVLLAALAVFIPVSNAQSSLNVPLVGDPTVWPVNPPGLISDIMVGKVMFNTLVRFSFEDGSTVVPDLATDWKVNDDSTVWTFYLRDDVRWHDGEKFTADDVVFTVNALRDPAIASRWGDAFVTLDDIVALDDYTVEFTFEQPFAPLLSTLAYNLSMVPKHVLEDMDLSTPTGPTAFVTNPIGTGPYKFVEQVSGSHITVEAYEDYHEGPANISDVTFKVIPDVNAQVAQLLTGELDISWTVEPTHLRRLQASGQVVLNEVTIPRWDWIPLNLDNPVFQDVRVRQAMMHALDREALVSVVLGGYGEVAHGPIPPAIAWVSQEGTRKYEYDPEKARELLAEAGWTLGSDGLLRNEAGNTLRFTLLADRGNPTRDQIYVVAQEAWKQVGMDINIESTEWNTILIRYREGDYDSRLGWWVIKPDPDIYDYFHSKGALNSINYSNPEVDRLLEAGRAISDIDERARIYHELQVLLSEEVPSVFLYYPTEVRAVNKQVTGLPDIGYRDALAYLHLAQKE